MTVKLNLTIDENIVEKSKLYAARKNTSVSRLVERLLNEEIAEYYSKNSKLSFVQRTAGTATGHIPDIDAAKEEYLKEKYGY